MKISTKGRYALRLMLDLAVYNTGEPISLKDIAKRQEISEKYLEQIISVLSKGGMVQSVRGAQGGYFLRREPKDYTVGEILRLTEGDLAPVDCVGASGVSCDHKGDCITVEVYERINQAVNDVVDHISLQDLVDRYNENAASQAAMLI
ncbi:MAG: Rrf2 family transcriptional regulator [Lachnospiraceae bacterium]|nr:Rrf2 family transcriptional regulator [Lachnospiraceae bacterium]MDD6148060.1 Rrf2 family transcriptional regulator [Lachnospiraceae bacterium]MDY5704698.1 Rrf2 family transcriptional regulator [Lachnospiraceae bacterium]MEE3357901.1 Rrf2 family transcriptional regulator [Lachnospiraceae bacterium]